MLWIYITGVFIITLIMLMIYLYNSKRHEEELNRITVIEKQMAEASANTKPCSINNLYDPRSCYTKSNYTCSWNEKAARCDQI